MLLNPIPTPYRLLAVLLLALACLGFGYTQGVSRESDRRDALELVQVRADQAVFAQVLESGKRHAEAALAWQRKADDYYQSWKEKLKNADDTQLSECQATGEPGAQPSGVHAAVLSGTWVGLYNSAWLPEFAAEGDLGRAAAEVAEAYSVTPREALDNIALNARRCGDDRKRLDELIDHLNEIDAR